MNTPPASDPPDLHDHAKLQRVFFDNLLLPRHQLRHIPAYSEESTGKPISLFTAQERKGVANQVGRIVEVLCGKRPLAWAQVLGGLCMLDSRCKFSGIFLASSVSIDAGCIE